MQLSTMLTLHEDKENTIEGNQEIHIGESFSSESPTSDESDKEEPLDYGDRILGQGYDDNNAIKIGRRMPRSDADSIVGGESITDVYEGKHTVSDKNKTAGEQDVHTSGKAKDTISHPDYNESQKVFSFSLPFGGLTNIRSNLYKQFQAFKQDPLPHVHNHDPIRHEIGIKLQRQQSVSTLDEANYFKDFKGVYDVRFRAVKHSVAANLNEMLPDFILSNKKGKEYETIYNEIDGNIVLLGGYRGSVLRETKTNKRVWIPFKAGFNLRKINLLLGPTKEDELNASRYIYPDGVLKNIGPVDICKKLLKKLSHNPKTNVKEFGYDWRLSGNIITEQFEKFLEEIYNSTGKPTLVIAHSMGGMIAHSAMQKNPKLFRSIVYVGVPSECLNVLGPIRFGDSVLFSDKILTPETNFMMRSSFNFLPPSGRAFVNRDTKEFYDLDYFDPETWVEYNLNPLVAKSRKLQEMSRISSPVSDDVASSSTLATSDSGYSFPRINNLGSRLLNYRTKSISRRNKPSSVHTGTESTSPSNPSISSLRLFSPSPEPPSEEEHYFISFTQAYEYLKETLKSTKEFILGLNFQEELAAEYPPLAVVYGNRVPSVRGSTVRDIDDIKEGNYYEFYYGHGDGVIHQKWLMPENKGFQFYDEETGEGEIVGKFSSSCGHVNLMTDFKAMGYALSAVWQAEQIWEEKKARQKQNRSLKKFRFNSSDLAYINESS
ncbi:DEHA2E14850p [Debaryomyces hansenii CBS767]|uniref:DEHA2E14850p n=1 Tax=Debaryomyces hansenii (strain ATCC 36239 / CBS 767 / BCRC 21394 / JCM 1990 / NBRC 0083 / IGC 2968) TaxID=284592 RepID=Q6BPC0_DEBHA|nr:DEHA2E14850p [Debaryomyces hansenii CBS767]CAG88196.2 DEHA2E14850p [Debaryomyces hansenii CBS767]|eukprot:XP_459950.2 DEHA2E14850p [Debaryomyces hansenii CBS767]